MARIKTDISELDRRAVSKVTSDINSYEKTHNDVQQRELKDYNLFIVETYNEIEDQVIKKVWFVTIQFKESYLKGHAMKEIEYYDVDLLHTEVWEDMEY